jgi:hypothetical protein
MIAAMMIAAHQEVGSGGSAQEVDINYCWAANTSQQLGCPKMSLQ